MRTSLTDTSEYREFCQRAATDPEVFKNFRQADEYQHIVRVSPAHGQQYFDRLLTFPTLSTDLVGNPPMASIHGHTLDPVMVRYYYDRQEIERFHGPLQAMAILEIGGGFGGLRRVIGYDCGWYEILDLPEVRALQRAYLAAGPPLTWRPDRHIDLIISTFAFSELYADTQREYARDYLQHAKRGYMICNFLVYESLPPDELIKLAPAGAEWFPEDPRTHEFNRVLVWGHR